MSQELQPIENIKIPYPSEGVIRTAQLDDTVAPENSVQLAVNMNFDRIGAMQTRPGVTEYADALGGAIKNYGTLRNAIIPDGYLHTNLLNGIDTFADGPVGDISSVKIDSEHVLVFWAGTANDGFVQVMETSTVTGGLNPLGSALEFDTSNGLKSKCIKVDATHFLAVWSGSGNDGFAQVFTVNTSTWAVTATGTALEFDTSNGVDFSLAQVDANHFICFYSGAGDDGLATILEVNLGTFAVTEPGATLTFDTDFVTTNTCAPIGNGTHFINFWTDQTNTDTLAQVFSVNTGTWAITAIGSPFTVSSTTSLYSAVVSLEDGEHFLLFYNDGTNGVARVFTVNTGTYAITAAAAGTTFQATTTITISAASMGDGEHAFALWRGPGSIYYGQLFNVDPSTFVVTGVEEPTSLGDGDNNDTSTILMDPYRVLSLWSEGSVAQNGVGVMFKMTGDIINGRYLYAGVDDEVSNWDGFNWTVRRSALAQVSKPRFSQYLNYIWMVNGNPAIGGNPVATSNGGNFGTDLVPDNFPQGDFIHAGFEGRVWVADKQLGVIHYTDIVQFTPPDVYTLTYDPEVNFITNLAPQTGQQFTALYRVPRALLVFTEDNIYRIYGATSIDAYPAYNVGTYSQESIVETKTGIFFHHSSGFYQFDYGSQPVEISRRVIDFVKAIPRSSYEDITGVYDGFDAIEWSVGQVVVEGVVFSNCVMRYTISTQVWTIYDYPGNVITAMIQYDDGDDLNHLMGTSEGLTGAMDTGTTDFGAPFYYEFIDRWRSFTDMYCMTKSISGLNVYSENAAGANLLYQVQKSGPNAWKPIMNIDERTNSLQQNAGTEDFDVMRLRITGNTSGTQVVIHGIEITQLTIKGFETN
jgi:hypothetical protein